MYAANKVAQLIFFNHYYRIIKLIDSIGVGGVRLWYLTDHISG